MSYFGRLKLMDISKGTDYIFPDTSTIQALIGDGMNIFRVQFLMERLTPNGMTGSFDSDYLKNLTTVRDIYCACIDVEADNNRW
jgi:endoglucanase